jgi:endonuclease YncB( thermonuclease family)
MFRPRTGRYSEAARLRPVPHRAIFAALVVVAMLATPSAGAAPASAADLDCSDFSTQAAAQSYFLSRGGPSSDPDRLDGDGDGIACESNGCPCNYSSTPSPPAPAPPVDADSDGVPDNVDACPAQPASTSDGCPLPPAPSTRRAVTSFYAVVTAVVDGDTIRVRRGYSRTYTVRLIGIDTPETKRPGTPVECGGQEATSSMFRLGFTRPRDTNRDGLYDGKGGKGRRVKVTTDPTQDRRDQYGRLLAYVKGAQGSFAGKQLRAGWAAVYVFGDPFEQLAAFQAAEGSARGAGRGAWAECAGNFHSPATD